MLTADGCKARRQRLLDRLRPTEPLLLGDPLNLRYFAGFGADPVSLNADFSGLLYIDEEGAALFHDDRLTKYAEAAHIDERTAIKWYDGKSPGRGPRRMAIANAAGGRIHDAITDPLAPELWAVVSDLRRAKEADELDLLRACMRATDAGHLWARKHTVPGMTELEVYAGIAGACTVAAGRPVVVYGDFAVSPGPTRRGGAPTDRVIQAGEMLILDFSVVIDGYRSDFTNTLVVGAAPTPEQQRLFTLCREAKAAGEERLRAGAACLDVYRTVRGVLEAAGMAEHFPHHAGHGLGLTHPEAPFFVEGATETLVNGDVVTLEPGLYVEGVGGIRIEDNYLVTETGFERLSNHTIALG